MTEFSWKFLEYSEKVEKLIGKNFAIGTTEPDKIFLIQLNIKYSLYFC